MSTEKSSLEAEIQPSCLGAVSGSYSPDIRWRIMHKKEDYFWNNKLYKTKEEAEIDKPNDDYEVTWLLLL